MIEPDTYVVRVRPTPRAALFNGKYRTFASAAECRGREAKRYPNLTFIVKKVREEGWNIPLDAFIADHRELLTELNKKEKQND